MPSANRMTTPVAVDETQIEGRYAPLGEYAVSFETFKQDADPAPLFAGLPDDRCQFPGSDTEHCNVRAVFESLRW